MAHREEKKIKKLIKLILFIFIILIKYSDAQNDSEEEEEENNNNNNPLKSEQNVATGKWNQFKGFYTPRPIPSNAHFTFASVWASWSAWSYCTNNIQMRVRACNTVKGFSCLGPNRDIRPCGETINNNRNNKIKTEEINTQQQEQFDLEDPWAEDRREALKQLYEKQIPKRREEIEKVRKPELIQYAAKNINNNNIKKEKLILERNEEESEEEEEEEILKEEEDNNKIIKTTPKTTTTLTTKINKLNNNFIEKNEQNKLTTESYKQTKKELKEDLQRKLKNDQNTQSNDTVRALEWMVDGMSKSLEQPFLNKYKNNKFLENKKEEEQNILEKEEEEENENINEDKVKNRKRPLLHSGELEENEEINSNINLITSTFLPQTIFTITNNPTTFLPKEEQETKNNNFKNNKIINNEQTKNLNFKQRKKIIKELAIAKKIKEKQINKSKEQLKQKTTKSTTMEEQLIKLKSEMKAMEAVLERIKNTEKKDNNNEQKEENKEKKKEIIINKQLNNEETTPFIPKIVLPIKEIINKNNKHILNNNNKSIIPILIGNQKIIMLSSSSTTTTSLPLQTTKSSYLINLFEENNKNEQNNLILTTTTKPLIFMKTLIQRKNNNNNRQNINFNNKNNTINNNKVIFTENPGSIWLDGNIPFFNSTAKWSDWSEWGECFCNKQMRSRTCIYEDNNSFHSQGCTSGKSYESKYCSITNQQCPITIPPIPPSKLNNKKEGNTPFLVNNILRRNILNITPIIQTKNIKNEGQNHQRFSEKK